MKKTTIQALLFTGLLLLPQLCLATAGEPFDPESVFVPPGTMLCKIILSLTAIVMLALVLITGKEIVYHGKTLIWIGVIGGALVGLAAAPFNEVSLEHMLYRLIGYATIGALVSFAIFFFVMMLQTLGGK